MANSRMNKVNNNDQTVSQKNKTNDQGTVEVLYQKMGDRWFAFSLIDDEVFVGSITEGELDPSLCHEAPAKKIAVQA